MYKKTAINASGTHVYYAVKVLTSINNILKENCTRVVPTLRKLRALPRSCSL